jgi:hypothetical protein
VQDNLVISVRNIGYSKNAGEFVKRWFNDIGSAGGHRSMAKAVIPLARFREKFGSTHGDRINETILELAAQFLKESGEKRKDGTRPEPRVEPKALLTAGEPRVRAATPAASDGGREEPRVAAKTANGRPEAIVR